jgi:hypothetical protein
MGVGGWTPQRGQKGKEGALLKSRQGQAQGETEADWG